MALKLIRDNLKSLVWVLWVVIAALVFLVFFEWGGFNQRADAANQVAASVGPEKITFGEFQEYYRRLENQYKQAFGDQFNDDMARQFNLPMQALNQLINSRILLMEARSSGLVTTDQEVRDRILTYPVFQREGRFVGREEYEKILRQLRITPDELHEDIRQELMLTKLDSVLAASIYVTDEEVERAYRDDVERAKIRFVQLPATQMSDVTVETAELAAYLDEHPDDFRIPERRVVDYLLVDTNKLRQEIEIAESELRANYDANQDQYERQEQVTARHILRKITPDRDEAAARAEIEAIQRRLEAGEDFATVAREESEDDVSARNGGMLRPFGKGAMVPEFEQASFNGEIGQLVGPVKTQFGFHLIEKMAHTPAGQQPFEQVQAVIRARLLNERSNTMAQEKSLDVAGRLTAETSDEELRALAEEEGLEVVTTAAFGEDDTVEGLGRSATFNQAAFGLEVGGVSEPVRIPRGWAVLKLKDITEPRAPELAEVEDEVRQAMLELRRKDAALEELSTALAAGKSLDEVAGELGLEVEEPAEFGRSGPIANLGANQEVITAALDLDAGALGGPFATDQGAVAFEVVERTVFDPVQFEEAKSDTRSGEEQRRLDELKRTLVEHRQRELDTNYDPSLVETFGIGQPGLPGQTG